MSSLKRKATGNALTSRTTKRVASGNVTPVSLDDDSDDSYAGSDLSDASDFENQEKIRKARDKLSLSSYRKSKKSNASGGSTPSTPSAGGPLKGDLSTLRLKHDHEKRPLWVDPDKGTLTLESFSPLAKAASDFLIAIAEPVSRPSFVHEYKITDQSLLSASSVGLDAKEIVSNLEKFSKSAIPLDFKQWITDVTESFGKIKLVLKNTQYYVESPDASALQQLLHDPIIGPCRKEGTDQSKTEKAPNMNGLVIPGTKEASGQKAVLQGAVEDKSAPPAQFEDDEEGGLDDDDFTALLRAEDDEDFENVAQVHSFQIEPEDVEKVKSRCIDIKLPISEEYDFRNDAHNANLDIDLRPAARIRDYQEKALSKMFGNGRAKSGIIVLPCGAGKTLVGITAACTVKKGIVVLCTSSMSVVQWKAEFLKWSNIDSKDIAVFTAEHKDKFSGSTGVLVTTYNMIGKNRNRSYDTQKMMEFLTQREWGLMILDEVHVAPAKSFRRLSHIKAHSKLGLTATLLREDDKISDLNYLIGPKLYEANWMELADQGHIARVQCAEVWCPMTTEFYTEYLRSDSRKRLLLHSMNPRKFQACQFLINYHENRGDKVIVFSDNVYTLERYARKLDRAFIFGGTPQAERQRILENFQHNERVNTMFLSKVGDTSIDLPEATCLIQVSSHYGSRRQEAQRLGRILRAKRRNDEGFNAFFYSLVSKDTSEMVYSSKRQAFLVDQGYAFKVITHLTGMDKMPGLAFNTPQERRELLYDVMLQNEMAGTVEKVDDDLFGERQAGGARRREQATAKREQATAKRMAGTLKDLSGGQDMAYIEYNKGKNKEMKGERGKKGFQHPFIRKLQREAERRRKTNQ